MKIKNIISKSLASIAMTIPLLFPTFAQAEGQNGTTLIAETDAEGFYEIEKTYPWEVNKETDLSELSLEQGEDGTINYELSATRLDPNITETVGITGETCVTNGGAVETENLQIVNQVQYKEGGGAFMDLAGATDTTSGITLQPGETQCYPFEVTFDHVDGRNYRSAAQVTITNHSGQLGEEFGPQPKADFSIPVEATIYEYDLTAVLSDYFTCPTGYNCSLDLVGPWDLDGSDTVNVVMTVKNHDAQCSTDSDLINTARLVTTDTQMSMEDSVTTTLTSVCNNEDPEDPTDPEDPNHWLGETRTQGYWKNHLSAYPLNFIEDKTWMNGYEFTNKKKKLTGKNADACLIYGNQYLAFTLNWETNNEYDGVSFQDASFDSQGELSYDGETIADIEIEADVLTHSECESGNYSREEILELKDVLDAINNGMYLTY